jgi:hypothetical protein
MEKINQNNRKVLLASSRGSGSPLISMYWDRIDKALFVIDEEGEYHRIYPSFLEGLPTVAAQLQKQKEGYVVSEIPVSNSMVAEFIDLKTIKLTFKNKVYSSTINSETAEVYPLPDGCIVSGILTTSGSKYTTGNVNLSNGRGKDAIANVVASTTVPTTIEISNPGSGYSDDTDVLVTGGSGANLSVDITTSGGRIERVSISQPGSGYVLKEELTISGGSGDATIVIADVSGGDISEVTIYDGGYNYQVNDVLTLDGGDEKATFTVGTVSTTANIVSFEKLDNGTEQDTVSTSVVLARNNQGGLYNSVSETYYNDSEYSSPLSTEWNSIYSDERDGFYGYNDLSNLTTRKYSNFYNALNGSIGDNILNTELVMRDNSTGYYWKFQFTKWTQGGNGGGFAYTRELISTSNEFQVIAGEPKNQLEGELAAKIKIDSVEYDEEKTDTVYLILSEDVDYSTYYGIIVTDVYNLAKEPSTVTSMALTINQPRSCSAIKHIYMNAYGSEPVKIYPKEISTYLKEVDASNFIYWQKGISWDSFQKVFGGSKRATDLEYSEKSTVVTGVSKYPELIIKSEIVIPDSVKKPDLIYAYYPLVGKKYLLNETSWIVGIIGSELDYDSSYYYVLYTFEQIGDIIQLTPAGSSSAKCGVSDWGGEWGGDILEFRIDRI